MKKVVYNFQIKIVGLDGLVHCPHCNGTIFRDTREHEVVACIRCRRYYHENYINTSDPSIFSDKPNHHAEYLKASGQEDHHARRHSDPAPIQEGGADPHSQDPASRLPPFLPAHWGQRHGKDS